MDCKLFDLEAIKGKKLLIMGGTQISCEIIKAAKRMGVYTVVADYNPPEKSPGKRIADEHFLVNITDINATVNLIRRENINGVLVGFNDMLLPYYAEICDITGFPAYGTKEQFDIFINKDRYKKLCRQYGVPTVDEYEINLSDFENTTNTIIYPVLVKPADSSGARGITICEGAEQLKAACEKAKDFSKTGKILVERYLTGREVTVNWLFQDGNYYLTCVGNRHVKNNQDGVIPLPTGYTYPASVTDYYRHIIEPKAKEMFSSVGIKNGIMFMQCKVEGNECIVYDIGYRLTGTQEYKNIAATCGYDPMQMMIYFALTGKMAEKSVENLINPNLGKYTYNVSFLTKPGEISKITGIEELKDIPGYIDAVVAHYPGEIITENMRGLLAQISLRVFGTATNKKQLWQRIHQVQSTVKIISTQGEDMVLPGYDYEDIDGFIKDI
jgi:biotin carboxylase